MKKLFFILLFSQYSILNTQYLFSQNNDNISLQGKSVMYNLGGKLFYGRPIHKQIVSEKKNEADTMNTMKISKNDAFGKNVQQNLSQISDTDLTLIDAREAEMKVRKSDVFGAEQKKLQPLAEQKLNIVETTEEAKMKVRSQDAFGNYVYENINPLAEQKVVLMDENESVMRITVTDAFGNFSFDNLNPDGNYKIQLQMETDENLPKDDLIYFANNSNEVLEAFKINEKAKFNYPLLTGELTKIKLMEAVEVKMEK